MKFKKGGFYRDGVLVATGGFQKNRKDAASVGKSEGCVAEEQCTDYYFILEYPDGIEIIAYLGEYCTDPCDGGGDDDGDGGGGGGGTGSSSGTVISFLGLDGCLVNLLWAVNSSQSPGGVIGSMVGAFADGALQSGWNWMPMSLPDLANVPGGTTDATGLTPHPGQLNPNPGPGGSYWQSFFHMGNLNAGTDLSALRTLFHEPVHAYLMATAASLTTPGAEFGALIAVASGITSAGAQHDWMTQHYIEPMADILQTYGDFQGYLSHLSANDRQQFYQDLAWGGLHGSSFFQSMHPNQADRDRIADVINAELNNSDPNAVGAPLSNCTMGL